jgi:hypothetical protein
MCPTGWHNFLWLVVYIIDVSEEFNAYIFCACKDGGKKPFQKTVNTYRTTRRHITVDNFLRIHRHKNLFSQSLNWFVELIFGGEKVHYFEFSDIVYEERAAAMWPWDSSLSKATKLVRPITQFSAEQTELALAGRPI